MLKRFSLAILATALAATVNAQTAKLSAPEKIAAGSIAVIDMTGSDGDRYVIQVIPSVKPEHLARDMAGKRMFFATCDVGQYVIVLTTHKGDKWAIATAIITVGETTIDPAEPSDITKVSAANVPKDANQAELATHRKWFNDAAAKFKADGMKSKEVNTYTAAAAQNWTQPWRDHFNAMLSVIERANPISPKQWSDAYSDIAKGIIE